MNRTFERDIFNSFLSTLSVSYKRRHRVAYLSFLLNSLALLFIVISAYACSRHRGEDYFPIFNKARWEYGAKIVYANGRTFDGTVINQFDGEIIIQGKRYFKFISNAEFSIGTTPVKNSEVIYYRVDSNGIYKIDDKRKDKPEYIDMPLPIPIGVSWISQPPEGNATEVRAEHGGTVEVNGRKYGDCIKVTYTFEDKKTVIAYYLARDIGIVKGTITRLGTPSSTTEIFLQKYQHE